MKHNNIHMIGVPEKEERKQGIKNLSEETWQRKKTHKSRKHRVPHKIDPKRPKPGPV